MNIKLPSVEYKDIFVENYMETPSDNELIIYFESANKIVVMNETMTCIWKLLIDCIKNMTKDEITIYDVLNKIKIDFDVDTYSDNDVLNDITEVIDLFFSNEFLKCKERMLNG